jgi:hypothetical protein
MGVDIVWMSSNTFGYCTIYSFCVWTQNPGPIILRS